MLNYFLMYWCICALIVCFVFYKYAKYDSKKFFPHLISATLLSFFLGPIYLYAIINGDMKWLMEKSFKEDSDPIRILEEQNQALREENFTLRRENVGLNIQIQNLKDDKNQMIMESSNNIIELVRLRKLLFEKNGRFTKIEDGLNFKQEVGRMERNNG